jgi:hypothetical protein
VPRGTTERVEDRTLQIRALLETYGCLMTVEICNYLGLTHSQAFYVLQQLKNAGQAVEAVVGKLGIWCRDWEMAERLIEELKSEVKRLLCKSKTKYTTPTKVAKLIMSDVSARRLFAKYIYMTRRGGFKPVTLALINYILQLIGKPVERDSRKVYFVGNAC